jgi:acetyltransferase-like isoleucine patch superfamily enzyme
MPDIKMARGSTIELGQSVSLFSAPWANPLRPMRPTVLHTLNSTARITIGDKVGISNSVLVSARSISVGAGTLIGAECMIMDTDFHSFPLSDTKPPRAADVQIGADVFIGARSIILKGVSIGDRAIVGAGSVVTSSIPAGAVAAGNPASIIRTSAD